MSCNNRDIYIRLFEQYVRFGGAPADVQKDSPIEKVIKQFFSRKKAAKRLKGFPTTASTLSFSEFPDQLSSAGDDAPGLVGRPSESRLDALIGQRRRLVKVFELVDLICQRESCKSEILRPVFD